MIRIKKIAIYLIGIVISSTTLNAQILKEKFNNDRSWRAYGDQTLTPSGSNPGTLQVANNQLEFRNFRGTQNYRLVRPIGSNSETNQANHYIKTYSNSDTWKFTFEFTPVVSNIDNFMIFGLTDKTDHWLRDNTGSLNNSTNSIHLMYSDPAGSNNQLQLRAGSKSSGLKGPNSNPIDISQGLTYYIQIERTSPTTGTLSVFKNSDFTNHTYGSPVSFSIDGSLGGLKYVQASTSPGTNTGRIADVNIDNIEIIQTNNLNCDIYTNYLLMGTTTNQKVFHRRTVIGSTEQTFLGSVIDFDDGTFQKIMPNSWLTYHSYRYNSFFPPTMTSFSYFKSGGNYTLCRDEISSIGGYFHQSTIPDDATDFFNGSTPNTYDNCNSMIPNFTYTLCEYDLTITNTTNINNDEFLLASVVDFGDGSDDVIIPVGQSYTHTYSSLSNYNVCLTAFGYYNLFANSQTSPSYFLGCTDSKCISINVNGVPCSLPGEPGFYRTKVEMENEESSFTLSPNPANNQLNIILPTGTQKLVIYNALGKKLRLINFPTTGKLSIDIEDFDNGIYIVSILRNNGEIENKKLVKQ